MATRSHKSANGSNGHAPASPADLAAIRAGVERVTASATGVARLADDVSEGAERQIQTIDGTVSEMDEIAASLAETAAQAESAGGSAEELVSTVNELAASIEQVTATPRAPGRHGDGRARGNRRIDSGGDRHRRRDPPTPAGGRVDRSDGGATKNVARHEPGTFDRRDRAAIEEVSRRSAVPANATDLAARRRETSSAISEMAASIEEVCAVESLPPR